MAEVGPRIGLIVEHTSDMVARQEPDDPNERYRFKHLMEWQFARGTRRFSALVPGWYDGRDSVPDTIYAVTVEPWWGERPIEPGGPPTVPHYSGRVVVAQHMEHVDPIVALHDRITSSSAAKLDVAGGRAISEEDLLRRVISPLVRTVATLNGGAEGADLSRLVDDDAVLVVRTSNTNVVGGLKRFKTTAGEDPNTQEFATIPGVSVDARAMTLRVDARPGSEQLAKYHLVAARDALTELVVGPAQRLARVTVT